MEQSTSNKAQLFSADFFIAITLVLAMVTLAAVYWNFHIGAINTRQARSEAERVSLEVSKELIESRLVVKNNIFDENKLIAFLNEDYETNREDIGLAGYDFHFRMEYPEGDLVEVDSSNVSYGGNYTNASELIVIRRMGLLGGEEVIMFLYVW